MENILNYLTSSTFLESLFLLAIMAFLLIFIKRYLIKRVAYRKKSKVDQKKSTFIGVVFNLLQYGVVLITAFAILNLHSANITSMLAGVGIAATIVGLALQDTLKDILNGINIYNNNFYKVGDIVRYNGETCEVKYFNARVTKFRSMFTNSTFTVPNSEIGSIEKMKDMNDIFITFPFDTSHEKIMKVLDEACTSIKEIKGIKNCFVAGCIGITELGNKYIVLCVADQRTYFNVCTKVYELILGSLHKHKLKPSYTQLIHVENVK